MELGGLTPKIADVESFAIENAFKVFSDTLPMGVNTVGILDIGHTMTTLSVMRNNKVIYTREQVFGGETTDPGNSKPLWFIFCGSRACQKKPYFA